jgi:hypothetical protein
MNALKRRFVNIATEIENLCDDYEIFVADLSADGFKDTLKLALSRRNQISRLAQKARRLVCQYVDSAGEFPPHGVEMLEVCEAIIGRTPTIDAVGEKFYPTEKKELVSA